MLTRLSWAPHRDASRLGNGAVAVWWIRVAAGLRVLVVNRILGAGWEGALLYESCLLS